MQYNIITHLSITSMGLALEGVECEVNEYIARGWKPIGSISMFAHNNRFYAAQAIIKEDEEYEYEGQICNKRAVSVH